MPEEYTNPQRRPRKRKRRSKFQRFMHRYFPSLMLVVLSVCCVSAVVFTISTISSMVQNRPTDPQLNTPSTTTEPTDNAVTAQVEALIQKADKLAAGYDYAGAISLLEGFQGYETQNAITEKIAEYTAEDKNLVSYPDLDNITHIFFHSLIVDPSRAFDGDIEQDGYNLFMVTINEFEKILQSMYDRGFVLVSPYDIAYEISDESGTRFVYGNIRLPEGKTPILMSQD
ncbi:MAG: polysaccharide deacetylase, partial [Oscillospiraceae bacterium]|nr:polysaccharide deacetylase [Oscillospiraceae bacterium]